MDIRRFLPASCIAALAAVSKDLERMKQTNLTPVLPDLPFTIDPAVFTHTFYLLPSL